jgi:ribonuclease P protein component
MADAARKTRLSRSAEFDRVYRSGRSAQHRLLVLYRFDRPEDISTNSRAGAEGEAPRSESRIGITVSKKLGGAVERNKLKRQLREALQACELLDGDADYVAIARPGLAEKIEQDGFDALTELVAELADKLQPATKR